MLIDSHVHVGKWKYFNSFDRTYSDFAEIRYHLANMGFNGAVFMPSELKSNKDLLADIDAHRSGSHDFKCWFFPWFNPQKTEDLVFAEEHLDRIDGFKFHPSLDRVRFTDSGHRSYLELARRYGKPILVHCGAWLEMTHYIYVLDVAEQHPTVCFILAHQGGSTYELKIDACMDVKKRGLGNVYFDLAGTHEYWIIEKCVSELGPSRFLLGSDFPIRDASLYPTVLHGCRLSQAEKDQIMGLNLLRIIRNEPESL